MSVVFDEEENLMTTARAPRQRGLTLEEKLIQHSYGLIRSTRQATLVLVLFCVASLGVTAYLLINTLTHQTSAPTYPDNLTPRR